MNSNIILIGMPGSGKSTCGVKTKKMLLKNFFDTDLLIQYIEGKSLQEIIDKNGVEAIKQKQTEIRERRKEKRHTRATR